MSDELKFRALMKRVYGKQHARSERNFVDRQRDFAFHMYDAANDVIAYAALLRKPEAFTTLQAKRVVDAVVQHAVGHLMSASRLYADGVQDQFAGAPLYRKVARKVRRGRSRSRARARG